MQSKLDEADSLGTRLLDNEAAPAVLLLVPLARLAMEVLGLRDIPNRILAPRPNAIGTEIGHAAAKLKEGKTVTLVTELRLHTETQKLSPFIAFQFKGEESTGELPTC